jgi:uncharacterized membrane-anchored protein YhcB (DUF1043 family)
MLAWWDSLHIVSVLNWVSRFAGAACGVMIVVLSLRESTLRIQVQKKTEEQAKTNQQTIEKRASELEQKLGQTEHKLSDANEQIMSLRIHSAQRKLSEEQKKQIVEALRAAPKATVPIAYATTDPDACIFALDIKETLKLVPWDIIEVKGFMPMGGVMPELAILAPSKERVPQWAKTLQHVFLQVGVVMTAGPSDFPNRSKQDAVIFIGPKHPEDR